MNYGHRARLLAGKRGDFRICLLGHISGSWDFSDVSVIAKYDGLAKLSGVAWLLWLAFKSPAWRMLSRRVLFTYNAAVSTSAGGITGRIRVYISLIPKLL